MINPYDACVMNRMVNVAWHVDDLKLRHVDPKVNIIFLELLLGFL